MLGTENPADMMTKHLDQRHLDELLGRVNLRIVDGRAAAAPQLNGKKGVSELSEFSGTDKLDHGRKAEKVKDVWRNQRQPKRVHWDDMFDEEESCDIASLETTDGTCNFDRPMDVEMRPPSLHYLVPLLATHYLPLPYCHHQRFRN